MKKYTILRGLAALALFTCLTSCQDEEFGYTLDDVRKGQYAREFEQTFGKVDPNQDWTMATSVKATINLPQIQGVSKMNIMTGDPYLKSTRLLAQVMLQDGVGSISFDAIKGNNSVFVTVEQDGKYKYYRSCNIEDGMLNVGVFASVSEVVTTRATTANPSKRGDLVSIDCIGFNTTELLGYKYGNDTHTLEEWKEITRTNNNIVVWNSQGKYNNSPFTDESLMIIKKATGIKWTKDWSISWFDNVKLKTNEYVVEAGWEEIKSFFQGDGLDRYYYVYPAGKSVNSGWRETVSRTQCKEYLENHIQDIITGNNLETKYVIWTLESLRDALKKTDANKNEDGAFFAGFKDESQWKLKSDATPVYLSAHPQWQYIDNVPKSAAPAWNFGLGYSLFGPGAFFEEKVKYYDEKKLALYGSNDLSTMEQGFKIRTTGGSITMPYIFGCTQYYDQFGYIYWKDGEDPLLQPHYVLMEDARPSSNIHYADGTYVEDMKLSDWGNKDQYGYEYALAHKDSDFDTYLQYAGKQVIGTSYTLVYFDENGNASTTFPKDYNIAFFIDKVDNGKTYQCGNYNYSLPELNTRIYNGDYNPWSPDMSHATNQRNQATTGIVKCIPWQQDGNFYLGFGDNSGDQDLNDIVFMVQGAFNPPPVVKVSSVKWHMNLNGIHDETDSDLYDQYSLKVGATYTQPNGTPAYGGRTFLGWAETPDAETGSKTISGTTTATTKCYYAIWSEKPAAKDPDPQSWLFACEDLGGSHDYDFNDVVWEVKKEWNNGVCTGTVEVLAAGGTLPFTLLFKGETVCTKKQAFSSIDSEKVIVNSGVSTTDPYENGLSSSPITVSGINADWSADDNKEDFTLAVETTRGAIYITANKKGQEGKTPQVLVVPSDWEWPTEGTIITAAYPHFNTTTDWTGKVDNNVYHRNGNYGSGSPSTQTPPPANGNNGQNAAKVIATNVSDEQVISLQDFVNAGATDNSTIKFYVKNEHNQDHYGWGDGGLCSGNSYDIISSWTTNCKKGETQIFDYSFSTIKNISGNSGGIRIRIYNSMKVVQVIVE